MSLNIKNERVCALVRQAAARTGQSQVSVVETALENYLEALTRSDSAADDEQRWARVEEIVADMQRLVRESGGLGMSVEDLYDPETGLPA